MTNEAKARIMALPGYLERNSIYKRNTMFPHFGIGFASNLIEYFEADSAAVSVTYPTELFIEGESYDGELEVRRDGTHAVRMVH